MPPGAIWRLASTCRRSRAFALFAHCFTCGKDIFAVPRVARGLTDRGIAVLRFDFTGLGGSEGEFANTNFSSNVQDLVAAADYLRRSYAEPSLLVGHSLGGAAVLAAAPHVPEATAVVTIGAPSSAAHVTHNFAANLAEIAAKGTATVTLAGRSFTITKQFLDDVAGQNFLDGLAKMKKALLVCHAPRHEYVGIENATEIFTHARHPKSFLSLDTADHLLRKRADAIYVADTIAAWASRYLREAEAPAVLPPGTVEVSETGAGHLAQHVRAGRHVLLAGEPVADGGDDAGPGPYDYLLAALGACTSMTMRLYAERKAIAAERFSVRLSHRRIHAEDCADCETTEGNIGEITRDITICFAYVLTGKPNRVVRTYGHCADRQYPDLRDFYAAKFDCGASCRCRSSFLAFTRMGRDMIAVGGDRQAAATAGVKTDAILIGTFAMSGVLCALSGALLSFSLSAASPAGLSDVSVPAVAAVILGAPHFPVEPAVRSAPRRA